MSEAAQDPLKLAGTIIVMHELQDFPPHILMLERAASMAFAPGALVFPGGGVEDRDRELAEKLLSPVGNADHEEAACRIAAIRETIEEAGLAIGIDPYPGSEALAFLRAALQKGERFGLLLDQCGLSLQLQALTPFARWRPTAKVARRYDTRFYLAKAPPDAEAIADGGESVRALWASATALLDDAEAGRHDIIFPTRCNLERLAPFNSLAEAQANGALFAHHIATGRLEMRDGMKWLCIDEGIGYPVTARPADQTSRG